MEMGGPGPNGTRRSSLPWPTIPATPQRRSTATLTASLRLAVAITSPAGEYRSIRPDRFCQAQRFPSWSTPIPEACRSRTSDKARSERAGSAMAPRREHRTSTKKKRAPLRIFIPQVETVLSVSQNLANYNDGTLARAAEALCPCSLASQASGDGASPDRRDLPERIGSYRVLGHLGRGGMGEVFLAWDDRLRRKVAIKRLRGDAETSPALRQRLLREARAAASLSHSAIVQVYDLIADDEGDCIVMEYVEGRTLGSRLSDGPLPLDFAVRLAREIADALAAAHIAGIVHRDLKADNVIVTPSGHARVLDFGLARRLSGATDEVILTQHGFILGTCHAMSPEQAAGGKVDARSDLFPLGILLHHMLTGVSPFLAP